MRKLILALMLSVMLLGFTTLAVADSILFPYINSNPGNVSTVINVINSASEVSLGCVPLADALELHYQYFTKPSTGAGSAHIDACVRRSFNKPTTVADIVTFDVAGHIDGGLAMFGDTTNYITSGSGRFDLPNFLDANPRRGYLLVTHYCNGVTNADIHNGFGGLDGEAMLVDIPNGAAYAYRAAVANQATLGGFPYSFSPAGVGVTPFAGMTTDLLSEPIAAAAIPVLAPNASWLRNEQVALYPPDVMQTRFMVTPLAMFNAACVGAATTDMSQDAALCQKRTRIRLLDRNGVVGVTDRDENRLDGGNTIHVRCIAGINLNELYSAGSPVWNAQGGWAQVDLLDAQLIDAAEIVVLAFDYNAIVLKLEFGTPFGAGGMVNSGVTVRSGRIWP